MILIVKKILEYIVIKKKKKNHIRYSGLYKFMNQMDQYILCLNHASPNKNSEKVQH